MVNQQEVYGLIRKITGSDNLAMVRKAEVTYDGVTITYFAERGVDDDRDDLYEDSPGSSLKYDVFYPFDKEN